MGRAGNFAIIDLCFSRAGHVSETLAKDFDYDGQDDMVLGAGLSRFQKGLTVS